MPTVLVVHEDALSQRVLSALVARAGHGALHATTEVEAWQHLRERGLIDLIVLDADALISKTDAFLRSVREDPVFYGIPVVVYIGQAERTTIYKYAQQGVQAMLAKPYKGGALAEEINKAVKADWLSKLMETENAALTRLGVSAADYYSLLSAAATSLEASAGDFRKQASAPGSDERGKRFLRQLITQSTDLGLPGLRAIAANFGKGLQAADEAAIKRGLAAIDSFAALLRRRVHRYLQVHDRKVTPVYTPSLPPVSPPTDFARLVTSRPLHAMGGHLGRLGKRQAPDAAEWMGHISLLRYEGPIAAWGEAIQRVALAPSAGREEVVRLLEEEPGLLDVFLAIAHRLGEFSDDVEMDAMMAVDRVGVDRALLIALCGRFAKRSMVESPLDLRPLRRHTFVFAILAYELASLLRLPDRHVAAAAALAVDGSHWLAALGEPLLYGLALAEGAKADVSREDAEKRILGSTLPQVGIQLMDTLRLDETVRQVGRQRIRSAGQAVDRLTPHALVVNLAEALSWAAIDGDEQALPRLARVLADPGAPQWQTWAQCGLKLPLGVPELATALVPEAKTVVWIADTLLLWTETAPKGAMPRKT